MRFFIFAILVITPCIYSQSFNRVFEIPKTIFLFISCGALFCGAGLSLFQRQISMAAIRQKISHPISWWLIIYLVAFLAACMFSMAKPLSFLGSYERHTGFITTVLFTIFYIVVILVLKNDDVHKVLKLLALTAIGVSLVAALQSYGVFLTDVEYIYDMFYRRVFGTLSHPVYLGIYLVMTIPLAAAMIPASPRSNLIYMMALPLMVFALVKTLSRGAFIAFALSAFSFVYLYIKHMKRSAPVIEPARRFRYLALSLLFLVMGIGLLFYIFPVLQLRLATLFHFSQESRIEIYKSVFRLIKDHPLWGTGPDTFRISFLPYKTLELARAFPLTNHDQAHNQFLHLWATAGIFPFIAYVGLLTTMVMTHLKILRHPDAPNSARAHALGIVCATIGYIAAMMPAFDNMTTLLLLHMLAGTTVILHKSVFTGACGINAGEPLQSGVSRYAFPLTTAVAGILFIYFGGALWAAEYYSMAGNAAYKIENKIAYYEKARRWMPYESYYDYGLGGHYKDLADSSPTADEKNANLLHAASTLEKSIAYTWQPENYVNLLGKIFIELGNYAKTESLSLKFLQFDPYSEGVRIDLILALTFQGRLNEALDLLERWIVEFPARDPYHWYAGLLYEGMNDFANAEKRIARAHELDPVTERYKIELARVRRILKGVPEPEPPPLLTNNAGQPIIVLENIPADFEPVQLTNMNGKPIIVIDSHFDD